MEREGCFWSTSMVAQIESKGAGLRAAVRTLVEAAASKRRGWHFEAGYLIGLSLINLPICICASGAALMQLMNAAT